MADAQERTEKATPKRRKEARRKGEIGNTPELGAWLAMLGASVVLPHTASAAMTSARALLAAVRTVAARPDTGTDLALLHTALTGAVSAALPLALLVLITSVVATVGQGGFTIAPRLLAPKFSRLNPLSGLKRMIGPQGAWQLIKALLKTAILAAVVWVAIRGLVPSLATSGSLPLATVVGLGASTIITLMRWAAVAGLLMAVADYAVVRRRNTKALKMTRQQVREELRSSEGDPMLKNALRSRAIALTRNRMFAAIADADVVLVNPTHVAVALKYEAGRGAPRVVAKGADHVAARLRELADRHRVPMVADVALARSLYGACEVGQEIPAELFHAVATVLAFLLKLKSRGSTAGLHRVPRAAPAPG